MAPRLRLCIVAFGGDSSPGAETVPQDALRNQRVDVRPVRALRLPAAPALGLRMDVGSAAADLGQDPGRHRSPVLPLFEPFDEAIARTRARPRCVMATKPSGASRR